MADFIKQPDHWLYRLAPHEWIRTGLGELSRAREAYAAHDARRGLATAKRAAGMGLNGALVVEPNEAWGRSYVDHVVAVAKDETAPQPVREACRRLLEDPGTSATTGLITLHTKGSNDRVLDAVQTILAHAYAVVVRHDAAEPEAAEPRGQAQDEQEKPR